MQLSAFCPHYHHAVETIGRRWSGVVIRAMLAGEHRFSDIAARIPGISDRLLSERLKELEVEGIVVRTVRAESPVRVEYRLTDKGAALAEAVEALSSWADEWIAGPRPA